MAPFRAFTAVKYARELAAETDAHFWGSKAGKGLRGIYECWYINFVNPEECLLT
jgi:hypothetical protein